MLQPNSSGIFLSLRIVRSVSETLRQSSRSPHVAIGKYSSLMPHDFHTQQHHAVLIRLIE
ncbi:hypothetical protein RMSM_07583 [Rhodopirellula maiorica SM1]|uniref:Uncharacterized protein n=1 Tax=Rhodopirellula maiorica SM1 TaxID=1265738 RepID=M5RJC7_9BACT|nr:hypothetical protein RMSM_07583 [Rhodopirellula maiorica SM1]